MEQKPLKLTGQIHDEGQSSTATQTEQIPNHQQSIKKKQIKKSLFIIIGALLLAIIGVSVFFRYRILFRIDNQQFSSPSIAPTSSISEEEIKIIDGSVYKLLPSGEKKLLLNKEDFRKNTERYIGQPQDYSREDSFFTFSYVSLSPDKTKMLLFAQGSLTLEYLYYTSTDGANVISINLASEAIWSNNSRYIAYANKPADSGSIVRVYVYDTQTNKEVEVSKNHKVANLIYSYLGFSNLRWLDDDSGIKVKYDAYKGEMPHGEKIGEGETILMVEK